MTHANANDRINEDKKPLQYVKAVMVIVEDKMKLI